MKNIIRITFILFFISLTSCHVNRYYARPKILGIVYNVDNHNHIPISGVKIKFIHDKDNIAVQVQANEGEHYETDVNGKFTIPAIIKDLPYHERKGITITHTRVFTVSKNGYEPDTIRIPNVRWSTSTLTLDTIWLAPKL